MVLMDTGTIENVSQVELPNYRNRQLMMLTAKFQNILILWSDSDRNLKICLWLPEFTTTSSSQNSLKGGSGEIVYHGWHG